LIHGGSDAGCEKSVNGLSGLIEQGAELSRFFAAEVLQHEGRRIHAPRRASNANSQPRKLIAAQVLNDRAHAIMAARAAVGAQPDRAKRQIEIARQAVEDMSALFRDLAQPASTEDRITKNTEYAKQMLEKSLNHGREITMLATKAGTEAADVLRKRATEGLDEFRDLAKQQAAR